jgi:hypothetical protein
MAASVRHKQFRFPVDVVWDEGRRPDGCLVTASLDLPVQTETLLSSSASSVA